MRDLGGHGPEFAIGPHETYGARSPNNMEAAGMGTHAAGAGMISHGQQQQYQQGPPPS